MFNTCTSSNKIVKALATDYKPQCHLEKAYEKLQAAAAFIAFQSTIFIRNAEGGVKLVRWLIDAALTE